MNLQSAARLVVFSDGSATSMRDGAAAADVLQWGWLAAGVPSVLAARWTAPGASSDRLLTEFYRRLYAGEPPAAALRAAQQAVRSTPDTAAPIHWAGWLLLGAR
jgi:CHAT domain-containing protein